MIYGANSIRHEFYYLRLNLAKLIIVAFFIYVCSSMVTLEEIKKLISNELAPVRAKIVEFEKKIVDMDKAYNFMSAKYDKLLKQVESSNEKYSKLEKTVGDLRKNLADSETAIDDLAQYLRRDCVEISGIAPTAEQTCEDIVYSLGQEMGLEIGAEDISTAHPLPTYDRSKDNKVIVKFTRRATRNNFYANRKKVAGRKISSLPSLNMSGDNKVYISESLTPFRKKLFGAVNKDKKKLEWKYIWTNNGRIYLKKSDNSKTFTFDSAGDLAVFEREHKLQPSPMTKKVCSNTS